jgi:glycosyltransferase involved in cell wall biosynthesis
MNKMVIITPHLSTGGCPQFVLKKIQLLKDEYEIYCIEYNFLSPHFVVQRNKVKELIGDRFYSLKEHDILLIDVINEISPEIIWVEEFSENFMNEEDLKFIFGKHRTWKILESTHTSENLTDKKYYLPDKFIFVSKHSEDMYKDMGVEFETIEYPVDVLESNRIECRKKLNFEDGYKHILNVGLFTPGKNQKYAFELAERLLDYKIKFHFVGNQADNFKEYWEPLMQNKPSNCIVHGEKNNIDDYLQASDLFLFTSVFELNPLVIKEALSYSLPILMFNLETYHGNYDNAEKVSFLSGNIGVDVDKILRAIKINEKAKNIRAVHLLIDTDSERERKSIESMSKVASSIEYVQNINERYVGDKWKEIEPLSGWARHGAGHYGAFNSFKSAIEKHFTEDLDAFMIFEADCVLDIETDEFISLVDKAVEFCEKHQADYFSFGDRFVEGFLQSPELESFKEFDDFIITNKVILAHCILFPKRTRGRLLSELKSKPWDSPDIWFDDIFKRKGIIKYPVTHQEEGVSMIDNEIKNSNYYSSKSREELIPNLLTNNKLNGVGVEIGVFKGQFSKHILDNWEGTLYMVDPWRELDDYIDSSNHKNHPNAYLEAMKSIKGYEDRAFMIRALSNQAANLFEDESLDFVYIDGNHTYASVKEDMELWFPKLKKGGLFAGHDYLRMDWENTPFSENGIDKHIWMHSNDNFEGEAKYAGLFGVNPAVDEFCKERNIKFNLTKEWTATWLFFK